VKKSIFPPSLAEIKAYCQERKNTVNPQRFLDYYESKGWLIGKNHMKDWKAAVRTWEGNAFGKDDGLKVNQRSTMLDMEE